jgi:hypothetical protein
VIHEKGSLILITSFVAQPINARRRVAFQFIAEAICNFAPIDPIYAIKAAVQGTLYRYERF